MALSLNKPKLDNLTNEIWKSAERLRGKFKAYEYQSVIPRPVTRECSSRCPRLGNKSASELTLMRRQVR